MKLLQGDCLELMKDIQDNSIDCIITDPPYKLNKTTGSSTSSGMSEKWGGMLKAGDKNANMINTISFDSWLPELYRIASEQSHIYIFTNDKNLNDLISCALKNKFKLHNILIWKKNNITPNRWYMKNCEFIIFLRKGKSRPLYNKSASHFFEINNIRNKIHPTQKPVELIEELIKNSSKEGDTIFDLFMGSGTTGVACKNINRDFIGMELDDKYFEVAKERINDAEQGVEEK